MEKEATARPALAMRHRHLSIDPEKLERLSVQAGRRKTIEAFTPEQLSECQELFAMFDRNGDQEIDRTEFGPMMRTLGLNLTERELDMFFERMDSDGNGEIVFPELVEFLEKISRPITLDEELAEAFRFFEPCELDEISPEARPSAARLSGLQHTEVITAKSLARVLKGMGEDVSEVECSDMITAMTGGLNVIDFSHFKSVCKPARKPGTSKPLRASYLETQDGAASLASQLQQHART